MKYQEMYENAEKSETLKSLSPIYFSFSKKGERVVGRLKAIVEVQGSRGGQTYNQYVLETDEGLVKFALGSATDKEIEAQLKREHVYVFTFQGKEKLTGGREVNRYEVFEVPFLNEEALNDEEEEVPY